MPVTPSRFALPVASVLLAVGAVTYSSWVLELVLPTRLSSVDGFASELFAADQPYRWFFGGADVIAGVCVATAALLVVRHVAGPRPRWAYAGWTALVVFGVATVLDVAFPLDCAPSLAGCDALELAGKLSFSHDLHLVTSTVANVGALVAMAALWLAARARGSRPAVVARSGAALFWGALVITLVTAVLSLHDMGYPMPGFLADGQGVPQRIQVALTAVWLAVAAASLRGTRAAGGDDGGTGTSGTSGGRAESGRSRCGPWQADSAGRPASSSPWTESSSTWSGTAAGTRRR